MATYGESTSAEKLLQDAGLHESHWGHRIILAEEEGSFTESDLYESQRWTTCACGKQDPRIPRVGGIEPKDDALRTLGLRFFDHVHGQDFLSAAMCVIAIERRARKVLMQYLEATR